MNLIIYEDKNASGFFPLSVSHPVFELFYGCFNVIDRYKRYFKPGNIFLVCSDFLADTIHQKLDLPVNDIKNIKGESILINAALKPDYKIYDKLLSAQGDIAFFSDDILAGAKLSADILQEISITEITKQAISFPQSVKRENIKAEVFRYLWDIVSFNARAINFDLEHAGRFKDWQKVSGSKKYSENVYIHPTAIVPDGVFIDAAEGAVIIDEDAIIQPRSLIQGPAYIGRGSHVLGGIVREGCSLGPVCKVGGELEETIIIGYSNKAHEGFIGHSYIGEWVNLGALTTNSDLKNNYSEITVRLDNVDTPTGSIKIGSFIGDHTKTGIGTLLNTGIVIGFCCNLYGGSLFVDKEIGHFKWGTPGNLVEFRLDKAKDIVNKVMARRGIEFTSAHEELFEYIYRKI